MWALMPACAARCSFSLLTSRSVHFASRQIQSFSLPAQLRQSYHSEVPVPFNPQRAFVGAQRKSFMTVVGVRAQAELSNPTVEQLKRPKMTRMIGTHNGTFHCDEALGVFMLERTEKFANGELVRTRDPKVLDTLDVVIDVGGTYEPDKDRYDHHQKGFDTVFGYGFNTKLSSAGLVYKHYGKEVVAKELGLPLDHPDVQTVYLAVYKNFLEAVDAIDNGVNQYDSDGPPKYISSTHLGSRVARLNPNWLQQSTVELENECFRKASKLAGEEFLESVHYFGKVWLPARSIVAATLAARKEVDPSGEILQLKQFCPWKEHLYELEEEQKVEPKTKYVLYEDDRAQQWRVQAVSEAPGSFQSRKPLPQAWRGLRDEELSVASGIPGGVFVHMSGFIGGNKTYEGALAMARKALTMDV